MAPASRGTRAARLTLGACSMALARLSIVGPSKKSRSEISTLSALRTRLINRIARSECPPSSKKLLRIPTRSIPRISRQICASVASRATRGATYSFFFDVCTRFRQGRAVEFACRSQGKAVQPLENRRHHVLRHSLFEEPVEVFDAGRVRTDSETM